MLYAWDFAWFHDAPPKKDRREELVRKKFKRRIEV